MDNFKTYEINVDTMKKNHLDEIYFNQGDLNTAKLVIHIKHNGNVLNLTESTVRLALLKVDNKRVYQDCTIVDAEAGTVEVVLTSQSLAVGGDVEGELVLTFSENKTMISNRFKFNVEKSIMNDSAFKSMNELPAIQRAIEIVDSLGQISLDRLIDAGESMDIFSSRLADLANDVKLEGAIGNGFVDDTVKLQAALNKGGSVYLSKGNYLITDSLFLQSNTILYFHPEARVFMNSNEDGKNLLNAYNKVNIIVFNANIDGVYNAGVVFPSAGTIEGQGVTLGFYGCKNIKVFGGRFSKNGKGSGNVYFSRCQDVIVDGVYIEKTVNGVCVDNYFSRSSSAVPFSKNISITNCTVRDASGRGIAIDLGNIDDEQIYIGNNTLDACAYAAIQINSKGFIVENNKGDGKRDENISTVGTQQSLPTYFGIVSDLGYFQNGKIINNRFKNLYKCGVSGVRGKNLEIKGNKFHFALSYLDQWNNVLTMIKEEGNEKYYGILLSYDQNSSVSPENINIDGNEIVNKREMSDRPENIIYIHDLTVNPSLKSLINIEVKNNKIYISKGLNIINYYSSTTQKSGKFHSFNNLIECDELSGCGIVCSPLDEIIAENNKFNRVRTPFVYTRALQIISKGNVLKNYYRGYSLFLPNLEAMVENLILADIIIGSPNGDFVFYGNHPNSYIVTKSDASGMKFIGTDVNKIKNTTYPYSVTIPDVISEPVAGRWSVGDKILWKNPTTSVGKICTTSGELGVSAVLKDYITLT